MRSWFSQFLVRIRDRLFGRNEAALIPLSDRTVQYSSVVEVGTQSEGAAIAKRGGVIVLVRSTNAHKWLILRCPCGCGEVRRISLSPHIQPAWRLSFSQSGKVSLHPSVWLMDECQAHFILRESQATVL